jgi:hypothetical protein
MGWGNVSGNMKVNARSAPRDMIATRMSAFVPDLSARSLDIKKPALLGAGEVFHRG